MGPSPRRPFGRDRRIRRRADFVHVQTVGERATSTHFVLLVAARRADHRLKGALEVGLSLEELAALPSRLGVVATRKVGGAVARNRIKRVCRECFRLWPDFVPEGIDLVVIAREGAHELPRKAVEEEWSKARPALLKRCRSVLSRGGPRGPSRATR